MRTSIALLVSTLAVQATATGQTLAVGDATQVRSVSFRIDGETRVGEDDLREQVAVKARGGMTSLRRTFGAVPFVPPVADRFFDPIEVQKDKERLRRYLVRAGYPDAAVEYDVTVIEEEDVVDILFRIEPGSPLLVRSLSVAWADSVLPTGLDTVAALAAVTSQTEIREGAPLDQRLVPRAAVALGRWLGNRGFAFAAVRPKIAVDSAAHVARVVLEATVGPRARLGRIDVAGTTSLSPTVVHKFLDVEPGDWFSPDRLQAASRRLAALDIIGSASFEIPPDQPIDTLVDVRLIVQEELPRTVGGEVGYATDGGIGGNAQWTHRSFFGGAQALTASLSGQSGVFALSDNYNRFVRGSLTFRQPLRGTTVLSLHAGPFAEYRDDYRDRSLQLGLETTLLYQLGPLSSIALRYELATRRIYEYRFGDLSGGLDFLELLQLGAQGLLNRFGGRINTSLASLSGSFGSLDVPTEPRRGVIVQPSVEVTFPDAVTSIEYVTANIRASGYLPLSDRVTVGVRVGAGKLVPFGKSVPPTPDDGLREYFRLRDVLFTAGGTNDVRGWGDRLLGPKFPQIVITLPDDSTVAISADRFSPIGGFNRIHGTLELRFPIPLLGPDWESHVFADAGRIWTGDERFSSSDDPFGVTKLFWALGLGIDYETFVGALRFAVGYKMNPSLLDLADPNEMTQAIVNGIPLDQLPQHSSRRFHVHFGIGRRL